MSADGSDGTSNQGHAQGTPAGSGSGSGEGCDNGEGNTGNKNAGSGASGVTGKPPSDILGLNGPENSKEGCNEGTGHGANGLLPVNGPLGGTGSGNSGSHVYRKRATQPGTTSDETFSSSAAPVAEPVNNIAQDSLANISDAQNGTSKPTHVKTATASQLGPSTAIKAIAVGIWCCAAWVLFA
jgi:hypothetical protein